jgi:hypothetical protein
MKNLWTVFAGSSILVLSFAVFSQAQDDKNNEGKPASQQETKPAVAKPDEAKPSKPAQEDRSAQDQTKPQSKEEKPSQTNDARHENEVGGNEQRNEQKADQKHAATNGSVSGDRAARKQSAQRIPDDKFREHFGREHHFRISQPVVVNNQPRFQYGGYWFEFIDAWPADWSYSDDCYIDYIDGQYFLFNVLHPDVRLVVVVVL